MKNIKWKKLLSLFTVMLLFSAAAITNNGKVFGHNLRKGKSKAVSAKYIKRQADGSMVVNTSVPGKDISGYGGAVPLLIHIDKKGVIRKIEAQKNYETPDFFNRAKRLFGKWEGKTVDEALSMEVDAVSGATYSSEAIKGNVRAGLQYVKSNAMQKPAAKGWKKKSSAAMLVVLLGAVMPLFVRKKLWHTIQLWINVGVLGLWCGTFISYAALLNLFSNGVTVDSFPGFVVLLVMLVAAFVYPVLGKGNYYCANICPCGSAQELAGKLGKRKYALSPRMLSGLEVFRNVLWGVLTVLMLAGISTSWMDYELFVAFLFSSASAWVIGMAVLFLVLSMFVTRPYCRFVCPTGALMKAF